MNEVDVSSAVYEIQNKIEEIMIFLVENNIDFDTITLFNIECCAVCEENKDDLINNDMESMDQLIDSSKIAPNILPLTLYYTELVDDPREALDDIYFLNRDLCITAVYTEFDKFISNMHSDGYELLYINQATVAKSNVPKNEIFSKYLLMIKNGYQLAIRAALLKQDINRTLKI